MASEAQTDDLLGALCLVTTRPTLPYPHLETIQLVYRSPKPHQMQRLIPQNRHAIETIERLDGSLFRLCQDHVAPLSVTFVLEEIKINTALLVSQQLRNAFPLLRPLIANPSCE